MVTNQASSIQTREFLEKISSLDKRISNIERTTQSPWIDWYNMPLSYFAYVGQSRDNIFVYQITDEIIPFDTRFVLGDKVRVTYNDTYYYGYVCYVNRNNRRIGIFPLSRFNTEAFTDIINATEIYWSKNVAPSGFDAFAIYIPRIEYGVRQGADVVYNELSCNATGRISMNGTQIVCNLAISTDSLPSNVAYIKAFTPLLSLGSGQTSVVLLSYGGYDDNGQSRKDVVQQVTVSSFSDTQSYELEQNRTCMLIYPFVGVFNSGNWWFQNTVVF